MSSTGAGFGFVGSTFGEVDVVSPYVQRAAQEGRPVEMPRAEPIELPDAKAVNDTHQTMLDNAITGYTEWQTSGEVFSTEMAAGQGAATIDEQRKFNRLAKEKTNKRTAIQRLAERYNKSNKLYEELYSEIGNAQSQYYTSHNKEVIANYLDGLDFLNDMQNEEKISVTNFGSNSYYAIKADDETRERLDLLGVKPTEEGDILYVESNSRAFSLNESDFISGEKPSEVAKSVKVPFKDETEGRNRKDGSGYKYRGKFVDMDRFRSAMAYEVFVNIEQFNEEAALLGLTRTGEIQATRLGISPNEDGLYKIEEAEKVLDVMVEFAANQHGFKEEDITSEAPKRATGGGKADSLNPNSKLSKDKDGNIVPFVGAEDDEVYGGDAFKAEGTISIDAKKAILSISNFKGGKLDVTDIATDEKEIYVKGSAVTEKGGAFDEVNSEIRAELFEKGILGSETSAETKWIKLDAEAYSQLRSQLNIDGESNPRKAIRSYIKENDTFRTQYKDGKVEEAGAVDDIIDEGVLN